jgi:hypothetical protein
MIDAVLLLPKILAEAAKNREMTEVAAKIAWTRAAGTGLRRHAVPFRLHNGTLVVSVADVIWQRQLNAMSPELVLRINGLLRRQVVENIEFRIDPATLNRQKASAVVKKHEESILPLPADLVSAAVGVADPELRQLFIRAAGNCIARREERKQKL